MSVISKMNLTSSKNVCLISGDYAINHIDHLAVIAYIMNGPIISDTKNLDTNIRKYYPQVKPLYIHFHQKILEYLASHHDRIFFSVAPYRKDLSPILEAFFGRKMAFWYCPHGNSDKTLKHYRMQDYALIYGNQMEERLKNEGHIKSLKTYIRTGNIRVTFYYEFKDFYDDLVEKEVFSQFAKKQTTYLYAPTWQDFEYSSSLFEVSIPLIEQLPNSINLIFKMHPWLEHHQPGYVNLIKEKYQSRPNIVVLCQYPLVLPILERTDLYLGDFSSIGYDFLRYNRPMFFFDPKKRARIRKNDQQLHTCGMLIPNNQYSSIFSFIDKRLDQQNNLSKIRSELYSYAFGEELSFKSIKTTLEQTSDLASTETYQK